jgi:N-acetylmuramoyl-L-alanine amidase
LKDNKVIAEVVTDTMKLNMKNIRDVKKENGYYMYSKIRVPGILVEAGFISNSNDNYKIRQDKYQNILVSNIAMGIENYFDKKRK